MRIRHKAGIGAAAMSAAIGAGYLIGKRAESRKSIVHKMKEALSELRD